MTTSLKDYNRFRLSTGAPFHREAVKTLSKTLAEHVAIELEESGRAIPFEWNVFPGRRWRCKLRDPGKNKSSPSLRSCCAHNRTAAFSPPSNTKANVHHFMPCPYRPEQTSPGIELCRRFDSRSCSSMPRRSGTANCLIGP